MLSTTSSRRWLVSKKRESANHKKDTIQHCPQNQTPMAKPSSIDLFCTSPSTLPPTPFFCEIEKNVHKRVPHICNVKSTACATLIVVTSHPVPEKLRNHGSKTEQRRSKQSLENSGKKCCERPSPPLSSPPHQRKLWHNITRCIPFLALFPVDNKKVSAYKNQQHLSPVHTKCPTFLPVKRKRLVLNFNIGTIAGVKSMSKLYCVAFPSAHSGCRREKKCPTYPVLF